MTGPSTVIAAVSPEGAIGLNGQIPWRHPGDLRRFKRVTMGGSVIMGRATWRSLPGPLAGRQNLVVTGAPIPGVECYASLQEAVGAATGAIWFIGGARLYREALEITDALDLTYVPDHVLDPGAVLFPPIPQRFVPGPWIPHEDAPGLFRRVFLAPRQLAQRP